MPEAPSRRPPGQVRDAILRVLGDASGPLNVGEICERVSAVAGPVARSSVQSYLSLNTPDLFVRDGRGLYRSATNNSPPLPLFQPPEEVRRDPFRYGGTTLVHTEALQWLAEREARSIQAVVTDPPYGLHEYSPAQQQKLRARRGGAGG